MFKDKRYQEIFGIVLILLSLMLLLSLFSFNINDYQLIYENRPIHNLIGPTGAFISHFLRTVFGLASYIFVAIIYITGWGIIKNKCMKFIMERILSFSFFSIAVSAFISLFSNKIYQFSGGYIGFYIHKFLRNTSGDVGACLVISIMSFIGLMLIGIVSLSIIKRSTVRIGQRLKDAGFFFKRFFSRKFKMGIPLNYIDEDLYKNMIKIPWIVRKKIKLYDIGEHEEELPNPVKYLEMSVPILPAGKSVISNDRLSINNKSADSILDAKEKFFSDPEEVVFPDDVPAYGIEPDEIHNISGDELIVFNESEDYIDDNAAEDVTEYNELNSLSGHGYQPKAYDTLDYDEVINVDIEDENSSNELAGKPTLREMPEYNNEIKGRIFNEIQINREYIIPTSFLNSTVSIDSESWRTEVRKNSVLLVNTLAEFAIESRVINVNRGPVVALYELQIAPGIKVNKIVGLSDDIAMALAASRVRIVAPIPGKSAVGVEIPNREREKVTLGDIIKSKEYKLQKGRLKVAVGKDILGKPVMLDLKMLPHLLIAGATGSGKSVCLNSIITSLIYNYNPNYVRFILVDPKMVELQLYNGLPHLLTPVVTEPHIVPGVLKWVTYEMDRRYRLLSNLNTRDIERYNEKAEISCRKFERLPYIVAIIDELADLMMVASKDIEGYITRIAQKARAVGVHLVLATQRPSVDVITGIIKVNFPARIAFQVAQKIDSRTIIDQNGAEKLLGKGDLLYQSPVSSFPVRIQGAFISEDEIGKIVEHLSEMGEPDFIDIETSIFDAEETNEIDSGDDELFVEALKIIDETRKASASYLQRRLSIGYNRAAKIIELMEDRGYVGPQQGSKPREVYI